MTAAASSSSCSSVMTRELACGPDDANPNEAIGAWLVAREGCGLDAFEAPPWGPAEYVTRECVELVSSADCAELDDVAAACVTCEAP